MNNLQDAVKFITAQRDAVQDGARSHNQYAAATGMGEHARLCNELIEVRKAYDNVLAVLATIKPKPQTWQEDH